MGDEAFDVSRGANDHINCAMKLKIRFFAFRDVPRCSCLSGGLLIGQASHSDCYGPAILSFFLCEKKEDQKKEGKKKFPATI